MNENYKRIISKVIEILFCIVNWGQVRYILVVDGKRQSIETVFNENKNAYYIYPRYTQ